MSAFRTLVLFGLFVSLVAQGCEVAWTKGQNTEIRFVFLHDLTFAQTPTGGAFRVLYHLHERCLDHQHGTYVFPILQLFTVVAAKSGVRGNIVVTLNGWGSAGSGQWCVAEHTNFKAMVHIATNELASTGNGSEHHELIFAETPTQGVYETAYAPVDDSYFSVYVQTDTLGYECYILVTLSYTLVSKSLDTLRDVGLYLGIISAVCCGVCIFCILVVAVTIAICQCQKGKKNCSIKLKFGKQDSSGESDGSEGFDI